MSTKSNRLCQGKDAFERMNFLYQAATEMAGKNDVLSCYYGNLCKSISKKAVLRMEPEMKRTICKRCGLILRPGISSDLSLDAEQNDKTKVCKINCTKCGFIKRLVLNKNYKLWLDDERCIKETTQPNQGVCETKAKKSRPENGKDTKIC